MEKFLGLETVFIKAIALPLTVASGLCLGKEGPLIHLSCGIGNYFARLFPKYSQNEGIFLIILYYIKFINL